MFASTSSEDSPWLRAIGVCVLAAVVLPLVLMATRQEETQETTPSVLAVYRSAADAGNVAAGRYGAVPVALVERSQLKTGFECQDRADLHPGDASVVCVRLASGELAWALTSELPPKARARAPAPTTR